jgi:heme-degrading monooxygenase HmoA
MRVISRIWRGRTSFEKADAYGDFLERTAYADYGGVEGNRGWVLLRRATAEAVEFTFVSFWSSMDALRTYTGGDPERPNYYPEDRAALLELPDRVEHHEVVDARVSF